MLGRKSSLQNIGKINIYFFEPLFFFCGFFFTFHTSTNLSNFLPKGWPVKKLFFVSNVLLKTKKKTILNDGVFLSFKKILYEKKIVIKIHFHHNEAISEEKVVKRLQYKI